jgi:hypothetical protein
MGIPLGRHPAAAYQLFVIFIGKMLCMTSRKMYADMPAAFTSRKKSEAHQ